MMRTLGSFLARRPKYGIGAAAVNYRFDLPAYLRITDIDEAGRFSPNPRVSVDSALSSNYYLAEGDLVVARTGASVGKSYLYRAEDGELVFAGFLINVRPDPRRLDPRYLSLVFQSKEYWDWVGSESTRSGQPGINAQQLFSFPLDPPAIDLQKEIAAKLADVDHLIASLERLIAKKRTVKQGMMQELLTGRTRMPGFRDPWQVRKVGDFTQVRAGGTPSTSVPRYWGGENRWMSSGEIHQKRVREVAGRITTDGLRESAAQLLPVGTVLMALAGQGKTRGTVAVSQVELSTNQSIAGILPSDEHDSDFLYYNLDTRYLELRGESTGDGGRGGLNLAIIKKLDIYMPRVAEQRLIAQVIGDVDDELEALERRLESTSAVKQGMMQELLTGRTRLPVAEEVSV